MSSDSEEDESFEEIREFFSEAEWVELSKYEKSSYRSSMENYRAMLKAGNWNNMFTTKVA